MQRREQVSLGVPCQITCSYFCPCPPTFLWLMCADETLAAQLKASSRRTRSSVGCQDKSPSCKWYRTCCSGLGTCPFGEALRGAQASLTCCIAPCLCLRPKKKEERRLQVRTEMGNFFFFFFFMPTSHHGSVCSTLEGTVNPLSTPTVFSLFLSFSPGIPCSNLGSWL